VEAEEERQGGDEEANTQQRVMTVGEIGEPAKDDDVSDQLIFENKGSSENLHNQTRRNQQPDQ
jgi:hypothetical protein